MGDPGWDRLWKASASGNAGKVRRLLAGGIDARERGARDSTALMEAARNGHARCVELLLPGSDAKARDRDGRTALMLATERGHAECSELLRPVSDARVADRWGRTALMMAAVRGAVECVERLLPVSDPTAKDWDGLTASAWASKVGHGEVRALLDGFVRSGEERGAISAAAGPSEGARRPGRGGL